MDDDKQLMKYLSWLDDLDQEYLFHDVENISAVRMDHQDLPGQCSTNNALQYDENVANYDYSTKIMSNYNVNETMMTEALSSTQSNVVSDPYNYNFMQTDNFYSNSVSQQHIPMKSELDNNASAFCIDLSNAVHSDSDSYTHTSDPQLCIDITAGSADLNMQPEQSHYSLTSNVDIKENLFHEEKHIIDDNFTNNQLSSNSIPHHMSNTYTNEFSNMQHQNELYCSQVCQEPSTINDMPTNQNSYAADLHNMNNVSNQSSIQPPIDIHSNFQEALKIETPAMKEEISCQQSEMVQESMTISPSTENIPQVTQTESIKQEDVKTEENCVPENKPTVNGVDKIGIEDEIVHIQMCIRNGCVNRAVNNPEWEQEFCSNECVIIHCRNVFTAWVKGNEMKSQ